MTPTGFYRATFDSCPGVGHCRHEISIAERNYELWDIMFLRDGKYIANSHITSDHPSYARLVIGKRIRGLP